MGPWQGAAFGLLHLLELIGRSLVHQYEGGDALAAYWAETWPRVRRTLIMRSGLPSEVVGMFRTMAALHQAFARGPVPDEAALRAARALWREQQGVRTVQGRSLKAITGAQLAFVAGDAAETRRQAQRALDLRLSEDAFPYAACDMVIAALEGPHAYRAREHAVLRQLSDMGCVNPERMLRAWFPVLPALRGRAH